MGMIWLAGKKLKKERDESETGNFLKLKQDAIVLLVLIPIPMRMKRSKLPMVDHLIAKVQVGNHNVYILVLRNKSKSQ